MTGRLESVSPTTRRDVVQRSRHVLRSRKPQQCVAPAARAQSALAARRGARHSRNPWYHAGGRHAARPRPAAAQPLSDSQVYRQPPTHWLTPTSTPTSAVNTQMSYRGVSNCYRCCSCAVRQCSRLVLSFTREYSARRRRGQRTNACTTFCQPSAINLQSRRHPSI